MKRTIGSVAGRRRGFSLVEVAVATAIIGMAVVALMTTIASGTRANGAGQELTQAAFLAQEVREWTYNQPFAGLATATYSPPIDGRGNAITTLPGWTQKIVVTSRSPSNLATVVTPGTSDMINVQVTVSYQGKDLLTTSWLVAKR